MLRWAIGFFIIAIIAGVFGFGGIAGAAIGDGASDCEKDFNRNTRRSIATTRSYPAQTRSYPAQRVVTNTAYRNDGFRNSRYNRGVSRVDYGYDTRRLRNDRLYRIDCEIDELRRERKYLKAKINRSHRFRPRLERRLDDISYSLEQLKRERKRVAKRKSHRRAY